MTTIAPGTRSPADLTLAQRPAWWWRTFGRPPRLMGLDVARGLAILGMVGAHIGGVGDLEIGDPGTWAGIVHGRPSLLFAVLAGVSIALMTGRTQPPSVDALPRIRLQLVGRGVVIFVVGLFLELLNSPVAVILTLYGLLYVVAIPFLRWRIRNLLLLAGALAVAGPPLLVALRALLLVPGGAGLGLTLYGMYPLTVWATLMFAGLALGRMPLSELRTQVGCLVAGAVLAVAGGTLGAVGHAVGVEDSGMSPPFGTAMTWEDYGDRLTSLDPWAGVIGSFTADAPHSAGTAEILGSGGFALVVIALCLLASGPLRWILLPLAALGSMPLTAYTAHVISIVVVGSPGGFPVDPAFWGATTAALLIGATLVSIVWGRGPLERLTASAARAMAGSQT